MMPRYCWGWTNRWNFNADYLDLDLTTWNWLAHEHLSSQDKNYETLTQRILPNKKGTTQSWGYIWCEPWFSTIFSTI